jgi:antitoxin HigA-1
MIHKPKHPGLMVKTLCLDPLGLTVSQAAKFLKISRPTFSKLVNGHLNISSEMAIRLSIVFKTSAELWINLQAGYDLWKASKKSSKLHLHPYVMSNSSSNVAEANLR